MSMTKEDNVDGKTDGETGARRRWLAGSWATTGRPTDRPTTVSQVTGDTSSFFSSFSFCVCGFKAAAAARSRSVVSVCPSSMGMKSVRERRKGSACRQRSLCRMDRPASE